MFYLKRKPSLNFLAFPITVSAILFLLGAPLQIIAKAATDTTAWHVRRTIVKGNHHIAKVAITPELKLDGHFFKSPTYYRRSFERDSATIATIFQNAGFLKVHVSGKVEVSNSQKRRLTITWSIEEGPPTIIDSVYCKVSPPGMTEKIKTQILCKPKDRLSTLTFVSTISRIETQFADSGYLEADANVVVTLSDDSLHAVVTFSVDSCQKIHVGSIDINALGTVNRKFIQRLISFHENDILTNSMLRSTTRDLYGSGLFSFVSVTWDSSGIDSSQTDSLRNIRVTLLPSRFFHLELGGGYKTYEQVYGTMSIKYLNFFNRGVTGFILSNVNFVQQMVGFGSSIPWLFLTPVDVQADGSFNHTLEKNIGVERFTSEARLTTSWRIAQSTRLNIEYAWNSYRTIAAVQIDSAEHPVNTITVSFIRDTRSDVFDPQNGLLLKMQAGISGLEQNEGTQTLQAEIDLRGYRLLGSTVVISSALRAGMTTPYGKTAQVPSYKLYYAGGSSVMRGYGEKQLGPHTSDNIPTGGTAYITCNCAEVRFPLWRWFSGVAFIDAGYLWNLNNPPFGTGSGSISFSDVRYNTGFGLRVRLPFVMISTDIGFKLNKIHEDMSGYAVHFNVGQAF